MSTRRFCVISPISTNRTWFENQTDAVVHAKQLLRENQYCGKKRRTLLVVEAVRAVEVEEHPIHARDIQESDFEGRAS